MGSGGLNRKSLIAGLVDVLTEVAEGSTNTESVALRLEELAREVREGSPQLALKTAEGAPVSPPARSRTDDIREVFDYWREQTDHPRARLLRERVQKIRARLREGFTVDELKRAIDGALLSEHHTEGGYLDIVTLFKAGSSVEQHINRAGGMPDVEDHARAPETPRLTKLRMAVERARESGDTEKYNELNRKLRDELQREQRKHG